CTGLFDVCALVTSLDVKLSISLWKCISRLCSQHLPLVRDRLSVCPFVKFLCREISQGYHYLFQLCPQADPDSPSLSQGDDKAFSKTVRILGFQMKVLVALLRDFADYLGECEASILDLLLSLHKSLPPCLSAVRLPEKQESELRTQVVNATVPCLTHLMGNRAFRSVITSKSSDEEPEQAFPRLLLQLMVLDLLPKCDDEAMDMWIKPKASDACSSQQNLLSAIFASVKQCEVEVKLPVMMSGVVAAGQPRRQVSLYEHIVTHICGMAGACPARHFNNMESIFVLHALGEDNLLSILATDCWCFLARYGTAAVCNAQVQSLLGVYRRLRTSNRRSLSRGRLTNRLSHLLSRLVKFMSADHQASLIQIFPPESDPAMWLKLQSQGLTSDLAKDVTSRLVTWALGVLAPSTNEVKASQICLALQHLHGILNLNKTSNGSNRSNGSTSAAALPPLTPPQQAQLLQVSTHLWLTVSNQASNPTPLPSSVREKLLLALMSVSSHLLPHIEVKDLLLLVQTVESVVTAPDSSPAMLLRAAELLSSFGHVKLGSSYLDCQVLECLPHVFYPVLRHSHPMIHQQALVSFSQFASLTQHEDVVPACMKGDQDLVQLVQNYVNQVPHQQVGSNFQLLTYLRSEASKSLTKHVEAEKPTVDEDLGMAGDLIDKKLAQDLGSPGKRQCGKSTRDSDDQDTFTEQPTKRRRPLSEESGDEPPSPKQELHDKSATLDANNVINKHLPSLPAAQPTATASPTAASVLASLTSAAAASQTCASVCEFKHVLNRLKDLSSDLEKACRVPPPQWFVDQALAELSRCKDSISPKTTCWLDSLS
ncbi:hypothetical protein PoB_002718500, partial [Plakobranchus ocellatus]